MQQIPTDNSAEQINLKSLSRRNYVDTNEWFCNEFESIYNKVERFVTTSFCDGDLSGALDTSRPWLEKMPPEFLNYTTMVAQSDEHSGGWNALLSNSAQRKHLLVGIMARILEAKVFGVLLFGATELQKKLLEEQEVAYFVDEGFSRAVRRTKTASVMVYNDLVPQEFDDAVTGLSIQIMSLFRPLQTILQETHANKKVNFSSPSKQFTDIFDIVAMAAHLSIKMRLSETIFYFTFERPGNMYDSADQSNSDHLAYLASKNVSKPPTGQNHAVQMVYRPLVQFVLWPSIKRYSPGNGKAGGADKGFRIYDICKCRVVYYWGPEDWHKRNKMGLQKFIDRERRDKYIVLTLMLIVLTVGVTFIGKTPH